MKLFFVYVCIFKYKKADRLKVKIFLVILLIYFSLFQCYKKILELEPENIQGLHNLCVVYVERGNLIEAENCLKRVHMLAPKEDYVLRHLQIVQTRINKIQLMQNSSKVMCIISIMKAIC